MQTVQTQAIPHTSTRFGRSLQLRWPALLLWGVGVLVAAALLLPSFYLILRAVDAGEAAWQNLLRFRTLETLARTLWLAGSVTVVSALIAVPLAWITARTDVPLRRLWAALAPLPLVIPSYVGAYVMASALGPRGLLQQWLEQWFGIERLPSMYGFWGALVTLTLLSYPYLLLSVRAALLRIDPAIEEAARSLGDSAWRTFWRTTVPLLRPALGAGGLLVALYALRDFGAVALMRYDTFTRVIYVQYQSFDRSQAALLALVLVAVTLVFVVLEAQIQRRARYFQGATGAMRPPTLVRLGWWRWPAAIFCGAIVFFSLVLPASLLVYWLVRGLRAGETVLGLGAATWNSILASGVAAVVIVMAALPVALLVVRRPGPLTHGLERLTYSAFALPSIVIALALVFFGANHAPWLYQTLVMLIFAYGILFLPQAVGTVRSSLLQIHPSLEEAARTLGRGPARIFLTVTLPLLRPGLLAGASMVFLTAMKELPATLLLAPIGYKTLATAVWSAVSEAFFAAAAAPALLIVLMSSVPMTILMLREQSHDRENRPHHSGTL
ncbi:MAG: iron ABC transporter permease [Chloroflexi bacterium]|nr:MAG: iron ABC transporter permease [Chloroflexota bacterium]